ncbi:MAG: septum formation initiator family protein [Gemmatimonadales bacterium]|nr:septum formation initiator family protein [Gemmatimonadota bacterium]MCL4213693.1 septum formation initiator family protein [Gemmatimonadales bacterium]
MAAKRSGGAGSGGRRRGAGAPLDNKQILGRVVVVALAIAVIAFALEGGEYGTLDLFRQDRALERERAAVESLSAEVQRLQALKKAVESDPETQERIAREEFGMVKGDKEMLYRFTDPERP